MKNQEIHRSRRKSRWKHLNIVRKNKEKLKIILFKGN